jgi:exodeoxyribonuclease VII large subunit
MHWAALTPRALRVQIERAGENLVNLHGRAAQCILVQATRRRERFAGITTRLGASLRANAEAHRHRLARDLERTHRFSDRATRAAKVLIEARAARLERAGKLLDALSYKSVLTRGYALVRDADGATLRSAAAVEPGAHLALEFSDGTVGATANGEGTPAEKPKEPQKQPQTRSRPSPPDQGKLF